MKRTLFIIAFAVIVLSFGLAYGQDTELILDHTDGLFNWGAGPGPIGDTIATGQAVNFYIRWNNNLGDYIVGSSNGFRVYSDDGAEWTPITWAPYYDMGTYSWVYPYDNGPTDNWGTIYNGDVKLNPFSVTGTGADTIGFAGYSDPSGMPPSLGVPDGFSEIVYEIYTAVDNDQDGKTLCLDSSFYPPENEWLWSTDPSSGLGDQFPAWNGGFCWDLYYVPNIPPEIIDCPAGLQQFDHCALAEITFHAEDDEGDDFEFFLATGPGTMVDQGDNETGIWSYAPVLADVGTSQFIEVYAKDMAAGPICHVDLGFTNEAPVFTGGCGVTRTKAAGNDAFVQMEGDQVDCDPFSYNIVSVTPTPTGAYGIDGAGLITFATVDADKGILYTFVVEITDTKSSNTCEVYFDITAGAPIKVTIDPCDNEDWAFQGQHHYLNVNLELIPPTYVLGGFDILLAYDASALSFQAAIEGPGFYSGDALADPPIEGCDWEYFTYRYGPFGNCGNACPSGMLRVVGFAETNNGDIHPEVDCTPDIPAVIFTLDFLVSNDRTLECQCVPVRFYWMDCGDNSLSSFDGNSLYISLGVFDGQWPDLNISDPEVGYPTYLGAQNVDCFVGDPEKIPFREVDFVSGGIQIACAELIDARGDVNLNEIAYEIADAVVFSNYFVNGIGAFTQNVEGQIAATDVNADGIALSVADLVYLIRVVVGDAQPYDKLNPVNASYSVSANGTLDIDAEMGAAFIVAEGNVVPTLHATNMDMRYNYDGNNTRILVSSMAQGNTFSGEFITLNASVVSVEFATYEGAPVVAKMELPTAYALNQNYPNPFNPSTVISFALPTAGDYSLTIYNVTGQVVETFHGSADAGEHSVEWMADGEASGIYFYKLEADNFTDTKKMILLK